MKIVRMVLRKVFSVLIALTLFSAGASAQEAVQKMDAWPVELYGQILNLDEIYHPVGSFNWEQIKPKLTEVLPESQQKSKSAANLCDHMDLLYRLYSKDNRTVINSLAEDFEKIRPLSEDVKWGENGLHPYYSAIEQRLQSTSDEGVGELLKRFSEKDSVRIFALRQSVIRELLVSYVHDAALLNCPDHAAANGYEPAWVPAQ